MVVELLVASPAANALLPDRREAKAALGREPALLLYRLEERGWLKGRWVEKSGQRRPRFYGLTAEGRRVLERQRETWKKFVRAISSIAGVSHA
jgi:predicted transcriptional regulator